MCRRWLALLACAWSLLDGRAAPAQTSGCLEEAIAQIKSVQGESVQIWRASTGTWSPAKLDTLICAGDYIYVGQRSRAAAQLRKVETVVSFDENTTILLSGPPQEKSLLMEILEGAVNFLSRVPRPMDIHTPFVNAGVEGTEFEVRVVPDRQRGDRRQRPAAGAAIVSVFEGKVRATNASGSVQLASGQTVEARVCPPQPRSDGPPECATPSAVLPLRIYVTPPDAVQWALYYPPVYAEPGRAATPALVQASRLISVGQVDEAAAVLASVPDSSPAAAEKYALLTVIAVARNERQRALDLGGKAVKLAPNASSPYIALSYAQQASFDLEAARDTLQRAVEVNPRDALAWARLAEVWLSLGYRDRALGAAERAAKLAPKLSRTQTVLGFAALAQIELREAISAFSRAIALDPADPLPHLGFGLARIRKGELVLGRQEIEIAAALDPRNSLIRSYLGKAYYEEKRDPLDGIQFGLAKMYDPNDPTPWLYDAIRKQSENRPVEALHDIQKSTELNDNRAVYRSQLLLDEDLAARGASLGRIYRDLGFEQLGLVEGWKSVEIDPSSHSAHRLLADSYSALPRHEIARDSELLQSQLFQPVNINPVQPRLAGDGLRFLDDIGPAGIGYDEFTRLFAGDKLRFQVDGIGGSQDTFGDNAVLSGIYESLSFSLGQFHFQTDGIRPNNNLNEDIYDAFAQVNLSEDTSVQAEFRSVDRDTGDRNIFFDPNFFFPEERRKVRSDTARVGFRHEFSPGSTFITSYSYSTGKDRDSGAGLNIDVEQDGHFLESRYLFQSSHIDWTVGGGLFLGNTEASVTFPVTFNEKSDTEHENGYLYTDLGYIDDLTFTLGVSGDNFKELSVERSQVNPKVGVMWDVLPSTTIRAAAFRVLKRTLISSQTIEPTQVAGFNQFFDDANGTDAWRYGVAVDQTLGADLFAGIELSQRDLSVPAISVSDPNTTIDIDERERLGRAYLFWTPTDRWALSAEYQIEDIDRDPNAMNPEALADVTTHRVPLAVRFFDPSGFFAGARATYVNQHGHFQDATFAIVEGSDSFWTFDAFVGYRFPNRLGLASLEVRNLFDAGFRFQDTDPENPVIVPERLILGRITLAF
jgi:tetratricopeptide (TPR) repeat protein